MLTVVQQIGALSTSAIWGSGYRKKIAISFAYFFYKENGTQQVEGFFDFWDFWLLFFFFYNDTPQHIQVEEEKRINNQSPVQLIHNTSTKTLR